MPQRIVAIDDLVAGVLAGRHREIARSISLVESEDERREELLTRLGTDDDRRGANVVGITGPPGAGKSTLIDGLIASYRKQDERVAVLAVDPSSPYSGGALLGDRIRMARHGGDPGVFIRSIASRGQSGGLAPAGLETATILGSAGFGTIIVESVGVGQTDVGIRALADVTLLLLNPGAGDEIQSLKAGVMEIADIFVINKADYPGVEALEHSLEDNLLHPVRSAHAAAIVRTVASEGVGIEELRNTIEERLRALAANGELEERRRRRTARALEDLAATTVRTWVSSRQMELPAGRFGTFRRRMIEALKTLEEKG